LYYDELQVELKQDDLLEIWQLWSSIHFEVSC